MAEKRKVTTRPSVRSMNGETIVIERHMEVTTIHEDESSDQPMLAVAFMAVAEAMAENGSGDHDRLEFTFGPSRFRFALDPVEEEQPVMSDEDMAERLRSSGWDVYQR